LLTVKDERVAKQTALAKLDARTPPMSPPSSTNPSSPNSMAKLHEAHNAKLSSLEATVIKLTRELAESHKNGAMSSDETETF
jgi:hypothetical protein